MTAALSKEESLKSQIKDFFDNNDRNKDGMLTSAEWDETIQFMSSSQNSAFALRPGGNGDVTETNMRWKKTKGLPYVSSALRLSRPARDGERRRHRHGLRREDRQTRSTRSGPSTRASTTRRPSRPTGRSISRRWMTAW